MFGLKKLFSKSEPHVERLESALKAYRSDYFPAGLSLGAQVKNVNWKPKIELTLTLEFAALSEKATIKRYLEAAFDQTVELTLEVKLPEQCKYKQIKHIILVASGKGGVGKSTTAVNLAYALQDEGARVGILDADIYGPSIPLLLGLQNEKPTASENDLLMPLNKFGLYAQSIGFLVDANDATVWRGPMASGALTQLLNETDWGELDYLIVDMPPGTGDIQLTMSQKLPASGAIIVTTPQDLAVADATKGIAMFKQVNMPILGVIENMSYFECNHCGEKNHLFGECGGERVAHQSGYPLLAQIPLDISIREHGEKENARFNELPDYYRHSAKLIASQLFYDTAQTEIEIVITDD